jgi:hypothetical protein
VSKQKKAKSTSALLLSGGNPRIAKAVGNAPVQAYIAAMPGWQRAFGKRLDTLITRNVPGVRKAVRWNTPFYGIDDQGWFLAFHTFSRYVKVAFLRGTSLRPMPPGASKVKGTRYLDIHEDDELDDAQLATWVKQAAALPHHGVSIRMTTKPKAKSASRASESRTSAATSKSADTQDWRQETLGRMRRLIMAADPAMVEERKWKKASNKMAGVPVWSHDGMVCTGETYKNAVKLTFAYGASLPDPAHLFNSSLTGGTRRAIDIHEGETVDARAFKTLVKAAVARNGAQKKKR